MPFEVQGSTGEPGSVLLLSAEDGAGAAIRPRLETAGGDASKVMVLNELDGRPFSLPAGYDLLEQVIREKAVRLVVIDPFSALVDCNHNSDRAVRAVLSPLAGLARKYKTAIMIVCHPNKRQTRSAVQCGLGSTGIIAMARSALLLTKHPDDPEQRVLATIKSNIGKPVQALAFKIKPVGRQARSNGWTKSISPRMTCWPSPEWHRHAYLLRQRSSCPKCFLGAHWSLRK